GVPSWEDVNRIYIVSGEDPHTTYKYAGLAAHMAFCLRQAGVRDPEGVDWLAEALEAYAWAKSNIRPGDENKYSLKDIRFYAAASLYRSTAADSFHAQIAADAAGISAATVLEGEKRWGPYIYTAMPDSVPRDAALHARLSGAVIATADDHLQAVSRRACRWAGNLHMPMLIGQATTPWLVELAAGRCITLASDPAKAEAYLGAMITTCDYFLGCNPLNQTWVTQLGERRPERVFHMDAWYNGMGDMHPGITPYGPWSTAYVGGTQIGPWDIRWPFRTVHPSIDYWPGHERWFGNYTCPLNAEFTVHQNTVFNAFAFGYLCPPAGGGFVPNRRPSVSIAVSGGRTAAAAGDTLTLLVSASDPDGDDTIERVEFFHDMHHIGETTGPPFTFIWINSYPGPLKLRARVFDREGAREWSDEIRLDGKDSRVETEHGLGQAPEIHLYPNPAVSHAVVDIGRARCRSAVLYDVLGREMPAAAVGEDAGRLIIGTAGLARGMYMLRIDTGDAVLTRKLIKH
ncbi:glycoside hydrolase family 9 protein, partial [bacterium]|nr:glycoside hydrolase family 9 protein [bacterium]